MQSGPESVKFFFGTQVVGYFEDQPPSSPGQYRYMPFRGPGHHALATELRRKGPQYCHYVADGETRYFTVVAIPSEYVLQISELISPLVSRTLAGNE